MTPPLPLSFTKRKALILAQLSLPTSEYDDLSPKGSIDDGIRHVIEALNAREGCVTTSSCAGRVSVFLEGDRGLRGVSQADDGAGIEDGDDDGGGDEEDGNENGHVDVDVQGRKRDGEDAKIPIRSKEVRKPAGVGGKGGGGRWLFVSHEPVDVAQIAGDKGISSFLGMHSMGAEVTTETSKDPFTYERLIHFKFEPMILHILTASLSHAQVLLKAALQAGFRETGALNLVSATSEPPLPMVAVRTLGPALDCIVGRLADNGDCVSLVADSYLKGLLNVANRRFEENSKRIARFHDLLLGSTTVAAGGGGGRRQDGTEWEDKEVRRDRMRAEGLKRSQELKDRENGRDS